MIVLLALVLLNVLVKVCTVAPGDIDPICSELRMRNGIAPKPAYTPNMSVLMDSYDYRNLLPSRIGAVWQQVDNDDNNDPGITTNWIQNSNIPCQQNIQVCGFSAGMQNNWLITQLINRTVDGTRLPQVSVLVEFEMQGCAVASNCQRTFNTHVYETSADDSLTARNASNYRQVKRVSSYNAGSRLNETITVNFNTSHSSFYFAIQDETTCVVITRLIIFYYICPEQTVNFVHYPQTTAPISDAVIVTPSCVSNAEVADDRSPPRLACTNEGRWYHFIGSCCCIPGYFSNQYESTESCIACPSGTYLSPSNASCSVCPANSVSEQEGLSYCTCVDGYYRALRGEEDMPCEMPPSLPRNLRAVITGEDSIDLTWQPPEQPGTHQIVYGVYISTSGRANQRVMVQNVTQNRTATVITNLLPGLTYTIYVRSENVFTDQLPESLFENYSAIVRVSLPEREVTTNSEVGTATLSTAETGSSGNCAGRVVVATLIPSLISLGLLIALTAVTIVMFRKKADTGGWCTRQEGLESEGVYYSAINQRVTISSEKKIHAEMKNNIAYESVVCARRKE